MDQIHDIRRRYYEKGGNISQIASSLQIDWRTVRKYIDMKDFNEPVAKPASQQRFCPKLDAFKPIIDEWLEMTGLLREAKDIQPNGSTTA